jgi:peroxiredoxin
MQKPARLAIRATAVLGLMLTAVAQPAPAADTPSSEPAENQRHPLLGKEAPAAKLPLLDGGQFDLASQKGRHVVVLDFWATWCVPCVEALPVLVKVTNQYADKGVKLYAVNQQETENTIRAFLKKHKLAVSVVLDPDSKFSDAYGVDIIPQTVIIDKKGVVQAVHIGYEPGVGKQLSEQLDAVLAGKQLAPPAKNTPATQRTADNVPENLDLAWKLDGQWSAVATDPRSPTIFATTPEGTIAELTADGGNKHEVSIAGSVGVLRLAKLTAGPDPEFLAFAHWGHSVDACGADGRKLWQSPSLFGIDDVWPADLDGDGLDEIIIGYNGMTGLYVLSAKRSVVWKVTSHMGNVWHVCAGDVTGDEKPEVITTSARGVVHVFDAVGNNLKDIRAPFYATMIRFANPGKGKENALMLAGGSGNGEMVAALKYDGTSPWSVVVQRGQGYIAAMAVSHDNRYAAVGLRGGTVVIIDVTHGEAVAKSTGHGPHPNLAWTTAPHKRPLLLIATGDGLSAYRLRVGDKAKATGR